MEMMREELAALAPESIRPLRRTEFDKLAELGVFEEERVELLFGALVAMSPADPAHDEAVSALTELFVRRLGDRARIRPQCSFAALDDSEPLPDLVIAPPGRYGSAHPARALLVVEIARTSLRKDRGLKAALYARSEVDEYWIVNLIDACVEVHRRPLAGVWQERATYRRGETLSPATFADVVLAVDDVLP